MHDVTYRASGSDMGGRILLSMCDYPYGCNSMLAIALIVERQRAAWICT